MLVLWGVYLSDYVQFYSDIVLGNLSRCSDSLLLAPILVAHCTPRFLFRHLHPCNGPGRGVQVRRCQCARSRRMRKRNRTFDS